MSSKKFAKTCVKSRVEPTRKQENKGKVWMVRIVVVLLCVAVAVTLIPSIFF